LTLTPKQDIVSSTYTIKCVFDTDKIAEINVHIDEFVSTYRLESSVNILTLQSLSTNIIAYKNDEVSAVTS
jgi:hypothetical protein